MEKTHELNEELMKIKQTINKEWEIPKTPIKKSIQSPPITPNQPIKKLPQTPNPNFNPNPNPNPNFNNINNNNINVDRIPQVKNNIDNNIKPVIQQRKPDPSYPQTPDPKSFFFFLSY